MNERNLNVNPEKVLLIYFASHLQQKDFLTALVLSLYLISQIIFISERESNV